MPPEVTTAQVAETTQQAPAAPEQSLDDLYRDAGISEASPQTKTELAPIAPRSRRLRISPIRMTTGLNLPSTDVAANDGSFSEH